MTADRHLHGLPPSRAAVPDPAAALAAVQDAHVPRSGLDPWMTVGLLTIEKHRTRKRRQGLVSRRTVLRVAIVSLIVATLVAGGYVVAQNLSFEVELDGFGATASCEDDGDCEDR